MNPWDAAAEVYDEARPSYPSELMNDLVLSAHLQADSRLLEIGAGTGKATVMLAARGYRIHCIEPGPNLAALLEQKCLPLPKCDS